MNAFKWKLLLYSLFILIALPFFWIVWEGLAIMFPPCRESLWNHFLVFLTWFLTITSINRSSR